MLRSANSLLSALFVVLIMGSTLPAQWNCQPSCGPMYVVDDCWGWSSCYCPPTCVVVTDCCPVVCDPCGADSSAPAAPADTPATDDSSAQMDPSTSPEPALPQAAPASNLEPAPSDDLGPMVPDEPASDATDAFDMPAEPAMDDAMPADDFPAGDLGMPAETDDGASPDGGLDDLLDTPPGDAEPPADDAAPQQPADDNLDDLFGDRNGGLHDRQWVDNTGTYHTVARLVVIGDTFVRLRKENGRMCTVPFDRLSGADYDYVQRHARRLQMPVVLLASI